MMMMNFVDGSGLSSWCSVNHCAVVL